MNPRKDSGWPVTLPGAQTDLQKRGCTNRGIRRLSNISHRSENGVISTPVGGGYIDWVTAALPTYDFVANYLSGTCISGWFQVDGRFGGIPQGELQVTELGGRNLSKYISC